MKKAAIPKPQWPYKKAKEQYESMVDMMTLSSEMQKMGWPIDRQTLQRKRWLAQWRVACLAQMFIDLTGLPMEALGAKLSGTSKLVKVYFKDAGAPDVAFDKKTGKPQLNAVALTEYTSAKFKGRPFSAPAAALLGLRKNIKLLGYLEAYDVLSQADGRIHASFFPFGAQTGRWSCGGGIKIGNKRYGSNLQQVPQNGFEYDFGHGYQEILEGARECFVADPGCAVGSFDFEGLELRLIAYAYQSRKLIDWIEHDVDVHMENAKILFPEFIEAKPKVCRAAAKGVAYGSAYSLYDETGRNEYKTLYAQLKTKFPNLKLEQAKIVADRFFGYHEEIKNGQKRSVEHVDTHGYQEIFINGLRVYYPSTIRGYNQALNLLAQGTGGELLNRAARALMPHMEWKPGGFYILGLIHDEIVCNIPMDRLDECKKLVMDAMSQPAEVGPGMTVSIPASGKVQPSWPK